MILIRKSQESSAPPLVYSDVICWLVGQYDGGLKMLPEAPFSSPRSKLFTIRTDPKSANDTFIFFSCSKLVLQPIIDYKWVCLPNFVFESMARRLLTICKKSSQRTSNSDTRQERCIKNKYFSIYFMLVAFMSPVKFSNIVFPVGNFVQSFKLSTKQFRSVVAIKIT